MSGHSSWALAGTAALAGVNALQQRLTRWAVAAGQHQHLVAQPAVLHTKAVELFVSVTGCYQVVPIEHLVQARPASSIKCICRGILLKSKVQDTRGWQLHDEADV
jgi:hypothetical protein